MLKPLMPTGEASLECEGSVERSWSAAALVAVAVTGNAGDGGGLEVVRGAGCGPQLFVRGR